MLIAIGCGREWQVRAPVFLASAPFRLPFGGARARQRWCQSPLAVQEAPLSSLIGAFPITVDSPAEPTYAQECGLGTTVLKWAAHQSDDGRQALEQLVASGRALASVEGLCEALRNPAGKSLADQIAVALSLKAGAYTDPALASAIWEVVSEAEWRESLHTT